MDVNKTISLTGRDDLSDTCPNLKVTLRKPRNLLEPFGNDVSQSVTSRNDAPQALSSYEIVFDYTDRDGDEHTSSGLWAQESQVSMATQTMEVGASTLCQRTVSALCQRRSQCRKFGNRMANSRRILDLFK